MIRLIWAIVNLLIPGAGLIAVRREWLGVANALLYTLLVQIGLVGILIAPLWVPKWLVVAALGGAGVVWLISQWLFLQRLRWLRDPATVAEITTLRQRAQEAMESADYQTAMQMLTLAEDLDDEDLETLVAQAGLFSLLGRFQEARSVWHRVERLDRKHQFKGQSAEALEGLSDT